jgi:radical SAM protein with 4Fe4S-binding SPASM domain
MESIVKSYIHNILINKAEMNRKILYVQFHITTSCSESCIHCYFKQKSHVLKLSENNIKKITKIINDIDNTALELDLTPMIDITGGDPLLFPELEKITKYMKKKRILWGIKGNPTLLTSKACKILKKQGIQYYQLSLDGTRDIHDRIRSRGSYDSTLKAISVLNTHGIRVFLKHTVSSMNINDTINLLKTLKETDLLVAGFSMARYYSDNCEDTLLLCDDQSYINLLYKIYSEFILPIDRLDPPIGFSLKDHFWIPLLYHEGLIDDNFLKEIDYENSLNCSMTKHSYILDHDFTLYKCRKMTSSNLGILDGTNFLSIISCSKNQDFLHFNSLSECRTCRLNNVCLGCPAFSELNCGSSLSKDPICFFNFPRSNK